MEAFTAQRREMAEAILFASAYGAIFYLSLVYLPNWIHTQTGMALDEAMRINTAGVALLLLLIPVSGWLGDRVLRRTHLIAASMLAIGVVVWPLHQWLLEGGLMAAIVAQLALVILIAVPLGSAPAMFVELFPTRDRLSGYSVAYNLGLGIVGGSTPMIATWLIDFTGRPTEPAVFAAFMALMAFATLLFVRDRSREPLG